MAHEPIRSVPAGTEFGPHAGATDNVRVPYRSSVVDALMRWVDGLPGPVWAAYLVATAVLIIIVNGVTWLDGSTAPWSFDLYRSSLPVYPMSTLALMHHLNAVARDAHATFRPVLGASDPEHDRLAYELTTLPWTGTLAVIGVSLIFTAGFGAFTPSLTDALRESPWRAGIDLAVYAFVFGVIGVFVYHTIRQLRTVSHIHAAAQHVNIFRLAPAYAFSGLTARTGIGLLALNAFGILTDPATFVNPALLGLTIFALLAAVLCFVVPLRGMHERITAEKGHALGETNARLEAAVQELYRRADGRRLTGIEDINQLLASLVMTRDLVARIPTWPWDARTLTGFLSATLLPIGAGLLSFGSDLVLPR